MHSCDFRMRQQLAATETRPHTSRHTALRGCGCLGSTCLRKVSSHAHACLRDDAFVSPTCLQKGHGRANTSCVFAITHVFARPVCRKRLRTPRCLHQTCLREVSSTARESSRRGLSSPDLSFEASSHAHVSLRRRVPSPDLSLAGVFRHAHMASPWEMSWPEQSTRAVSSDTHVFSLRDVSSRKCVLKRLRVFAVFA